MEKSRKKRLKIGAHMSISSGFTGALRDAESIQATTMQIFTANQRQWQHKHIDASQIEDYRRALAESEVSDVASHASYLINLGAPSEEVLLKSRRALQEEIERCLALGVRYLIFHPGAALSESKEQCLDRIVESLLLSASLLDGKENSLTLLIETMAGQGSVVGRSFEEIGFIIDRTKKTLPIGVCMDTCHLFAAGYDIRNKTALQKTLFEFDRIIGLDILKALHLNDSQKGLGSHVDRHALLGEGMIGLDAFLALVHHPLLSTLPMYIETPGGLEVWKKEIELLQREYICVHE